MINLNNVGIKNQENKSLPYFINRGKVCSSISKIILFMKQRSFIFYHIKWFLEVYDQSIEFTLVNTCFEIIT